MISKKILYIVLCFFLFFLSFVFNNSFAGSCAIQTNRWWWVNSTCWNGTASWCNLMNYPNWTPASQNCSSSAECSSLIWSSWFPDINQSNIQYSILNAECSINGSCGTTAWACAEWIKINDNNNNTCWTQRTWNCNGVAGWAQSPLCFVNNPVCSTSTTTSTSASFSVLYPLWLYLNQRNVLYTQSGAIPLFCPTTSSGSRCLLVEDVYDQQHQVQALSDQINRLLVEYLTLRDHPQSLREHVSHELHITILVY